MMNDLGIKTFKRLGKKGIFLHWELRACFQTKNRSWKYPCNNYNSRHVFLWYMYVQLVYYIYLGKKVKEKLIQG